MHWMIYNIARNFWERERESSESEKERENQVIIEIKKVKNGSKKSQREIMHFSSSSQVHAGIKASHPN